MFFFNKRVQAELFNLTQRIIDMSTQLDALTAQVTATNSVSASAITLLQGLSAQLTAAIAAQPTDDGAALDSLSSALDTQSTALAAAITANTPVTPAAAAASGPAAA
jgi:hypothetical protein